MKQTTLDQLNLRLRSFKYFQRHPVIFRVVSSLTIIDKQCNSGSRTPHYHREWKCSLGPVDHLKWDIRKEKKTTTAETVIGFVHERKPQTKRKSKCKTFLLIHYCLKKN